MLVEKYWVIVCEKNEGMLKEDKMAVNRSTFLPTLLCEMKVEHLRRNIEGIGIP